MSSKPPENPPTVEEMRKDLKERYSRSATFLRNGKSFELNTLFNKAQKYVEKTEPGVDIAKKAETAKGQSKMLILGTVSLLYRYHLLR